MIPLRDSIKSRTFPFINTALIAVNAFIFLYEVSLGSEINRFIYNYGLVPAYLFSSGDISFVDRIFPFFTSMFLHGGWLHAIGNMLFLHIFGDNVEDRMGHFKYLLFYVLAGLGAALFQVITNLDSQIPMIGASGAISGVLGAYIIFFPKSKILTLIPIFFFIQLVHIPAFVFILFWFVIQFLSGLGSLGMPDVGGVAFWAHIGGFITGLILARFFQKKSNLQIESVSRYYH